jgi:hypothetical protein
MTGLRAVLLLLALATPAAAAPQEPPSAEPMPAVVDYRMRVRLAESDAGPRLEGRLTVTWANPAEAPTDELRWHVYNNAWESAESVWLREASRQGSTDTPRAWGSTEVSAVRLVAPDGTLGAALDWEFLPQPGAPLDRTVARTALPEPVAPGASVSVELLFETLLPPAFRRSGWGSDGYIHAVQWFPKLGVFEQWDSDGDGAEEWAWNCLPYHFNSEYYADFGSYQLELTLPARYEDKVVATGSTVEGWPRLQGDEVVYLFRAEQVHDFAWTGDPQAVLLTREFREEAWRDVEEEQRVARALGVTPEEIRPGPVTMHLLLQPEHAEYEDRYFEAVAKSLYYFGLWYGAYPYPTVSCVDPAHDARATGGMEYPRLFTGGVNKGMHQRTLKPESVTVHEFGHQYWYGMVGNDEFHHAWLDEGFTTYSQNRVLALGWPPELATYEVLGREYLGRAPLALPDYPEGDPRALFTLRRWESPDLKVLPELSVELRRGTPLQRWVAELPPVTYWPEVWTDPLDRRRFRHAEEWAEPLAHPTWAVHDRGASRINAYSRPAMMLETIAGLMGEERWTRLLRDYHLTWRFRHPRPQDFLDKVLEHASGASLAAGGEEVAIDWRDFWRQAYHGEERMSFAAERLVQVPHEGGGWDVHMTVRRMEAFRVPVEIRLTWADGSTSDYVWDGQASVWQRSVEGATQRAVRLEVDPRHLLMLDRDRLDNAVVAEPDDRRARNASLRVLLWAQQVLHYYGGAG